MKSNSLFLMFTVSMLAITLLCGFRNANEITVRGGGYTGTCVNQTYGSSAQLQLSLHRTGDEVSGTLTISGKLIGGGPITGSIEGDNVTFSTIGRDFGKITWFGRIEGKGIKGSYVVENPDGRIQKGIWSVTRK